MQSITTYGFTMNFDDVYKDQYLELKDTIERLCRNSEKLSILYNRNPLIHYLAISKSTYITCIVINQKAEFGIYKKENKE